jgi:hypothetical protein
MAMHSEKIHVARTFDEIESLRNVWNTMPFFIWADIDFYLSVIRSRPEVLRPHVVLLEKSGRPMALLVARLEEIPFRSRIGYKVVFSPTVRSLTVVYGGIAYADDNSGEDLFKALVASIENGDADVLMLGNLRTDTSFYRSSLSYAGFFRHQHFTMTSKHWRLFLPPSYDDFLASRTRSTRESVRRYKRRLEREFGNELIFEVYREEKDYDRIVRDLDLIAGKTYQRGLGVGFEPTEEQLSHLRLSLKHRWYRAYVLYLRGEPVAFWDGHAYKGTFFISIPGYDPSFSDYRVGLYVQMRMIEDLCRDPDVKVLDYGLGDADYKRQFGNDSWEERNVVIFSPTLKGISVNMISTAILAITKASKYLLSSVGVFEKVMSIWREKLRQGG